MQSDKKQLLSIPAGSQIGQLIQTFDWTRTSLPPLQEWPQSLLTAVQNLLYARNPTVLLWGKDFLCFYNDSFAASLPAATEPLIGATAQRLWPDTWPDLHGRITRVMTTGESLLTEPDLAPFHIGEGHTRTVAVCCTALTDDAGVAAGVLLAYAKDVSGSRFPGSRLHEQHEQQRRLYETIIDMTPDLVYAFDLQYRFTYVNPALLNMWGKTWETAIGKGLRENGYEEWHAAMHEREIDHVAATGESVRGEVSFPHATLGRRIYDYILVPVWNKEGKVEAVGGTTRDVTELRQAVMKAQENEASLRDAIELAELGTWSLDIAANSLQLSERHAAMLGSDKTRVSPLDVLALIPQEHRDDAKTTVQSAGKSGDGRYYLEYPIRHTASGKLRILQALGQAYFDDSGKLIHIHGVTQDVTSQRELQLTLEREVDVRTQELAATNEELQAANEELLATNEELSESTTALTRLNQELEQFAYAASHDLQEPLRKIQTFADRLNKLAGVPEQGIEWTTKIYQSATRMATLIKGILEYSHLSERQQAHEDIDLNIILAEVQDDFAFTIEQRGATLHIDKLPILKASQLHMQQLFTNLLSNALKFVPEERSPEICIKYRVASMEEMNALSFNPKSASYHHISVSDNGIGFDMKYIEHIFQIFKRLHGRNEYRGSGIGLALCKRIVTAHHGYINANSVPGAGTTFHIYLSQQE